MSALHSVSLGENLKACRDGDTPGAVALRPRGPSRVTCSPMTRGVGAAVPPPRLKDGEKEKGDKNQHLDLQEEKLFSLKLNILVLHILSSS